MIKSDYRSELTNKLEISGMKFLNGFTNLEVKRNNTKTITEPDYIKPDKRYVDFQFSTNFESYQDFRVDIMSAFTFPNVKTPEELDFESSIKIDRLKNQEINKYDDLFSLIEKEFYFLAKKGKYFEEDKLDQVIFFIYNDKEPDYNKKPDKIFIAEKNDILTYIEKNLHYIKYKLKVNVKRDVNDIHGSMFLPINLNKFIEYNEYITKDYETTKNEKIEIIVKNEMVLSGKAIDILEEQELNKLLEKQSKKIKNESSKRDKDYLNTTTKNKI